MIREDLHGDEERCLELDEGSRASDVLDCLDVNREEVLISRNGDIVSENAPLEDGDEVMVVDVIAGG